jgi:hypothetical protein
VKSFYMLKLPVFLLGLGGALLLSPICKAQESSPQSFTDTGVQDYYENAPVKPVAAKQKPTAVPAVKQKTAPAVKLQPAVDRSSSAAKQPGTKPVADKRKQTPNASKKQ